jgi:hypothetical protein
MRKNMVQYVNVNVLIGESNANFTAQSTDSCLENENVDRIVRILVHNLNEI